jgi:hypothetical protein
MRLLRYARNDGSFLFFLIKKETKKSRTKNIQPVCSAALWNYGSLVASAIVLYCYNSSVNFIVIIFCNSFPTVYSFYFFLMPLQ